METITFKGPFHFDEINQKKNTIIRDGNKLELSIPGIYIWGFMYSKLEGEIVDPLDYNDGNNKIYDESKMQFIPYYVGKHEKSIAERLIEHNGVRSNNNAKKYTRLNFDYIKEFFKDLNFPINIGGKNIYEFIKLGQNDKVLYYNHFGFLSVKYQNKFKELLNDNNFKLKSILDVPITDFKFLDKKDTLNLLVDKNELNNFWFCFAEYPIEKGPITQVLESLETLTFYSLLGKTISKTGLFEDLTDIISLNDETTTNIFKEKKITIEKIKDDYYDDNNNGNKVKFPGY